MPLCIPLIAGPLNEWSDSILVLGAMPGATLSVHAIGNSSRQVGESTAQGGVDLVRLRPGERLLAPDRLVVTQWLAGESSLATPDHLATPVGPAPTEHVQLSPLTIRTRLFACGGAIWVAGAAPGALVVVDGLGSARANEYGDARFPHGGLSPGQSVNAWQEAPPGFTPLSGTASITTGSTQMSFPIGTKLPPPVLAQDPPEGCDPSVQLAGIVDGAEVTITRTSDGSSEAAMFDLDQLRFDLTRPLAASGDKLEIIQRLTRCSEWPPSDPLVVPVSPATTPGTPELMRPCPETYDVYASNLEPGAIATLSYDFQTYKAMVPQDSTTFVFRLTRLGTGGTITLMQERCGLASGVASVQVPTGISGPFAPPSLAEPLFGCARAVRVRARPGTWLQVWALGPGGPMPISAQTFCTGSTRISVAPFLVAGQEVWLASLSCGATAWKRAASQWVQPTPDVVPPDITVALVEGARSVTVEALPGALVTVHALTPGQFPAYQILGSGLMDPHDKRVWLWRGLTTRDVVHATQTLCSRTSRPSAARVPIPNQVTFDLGTPIKRMSTQSSSMKHLVCQAASVSCHHDGRWHFIADMENQETEADCQFLLQFTILGVIPSFGAIIDGDLSAAGDGPITKTGARILGVPPNATFPKPGFYDGFRNPDYWALVYSSSHAFSFNAVAWNSDPPYPDEGEYEDKDDKKPGTSK